MLHLLSWLPRHIRRGPDHAWHLLLLFNLDLQLHSELQSLVGNSRQSSLNHIPSSSPRNSSYLHQDQFFPFSKMSHRSKSSNSKRGEVEVYYADNSVSKDLWPVDPSKSPLVPPYKGPRGSPGSNMYLDRDFYSVSTIHEDFLHFCFQPLEEKFKRLSVGMGPGNTLIAPSVRELQSLCSCINHCYDHLEQQTRRSGGRLTSQEIFKRAYNIDYVQKVYSLQYRYERSWGHEVKFVRERAGSELPNE